MSVRVYEIAKQAGISAKEAVERIRSIGIDVKSHSSTVDEETARRILDELAAGADTAAPAAAPIDAGESGPALEEAAPAETAAADDEAAEPVAEAEEPAEPVEVGPPMIRMKPPIVVRDLAANLEIKPNQLITELMMMNVLASISQPIESDVAVTICEQHGVILEVERREKVRKAPDAPDEAEEPGQEPVEVEEEEEVPAGAAGEPGEAAEAPVEGEAPEGVAVGDEAEQPVPAVRPKKKKKKGRTAVSAEAVSRPPVVTFMGHVDHGKTSLLDRIRHTQVTASEAGGITQHIGAYQVETPGGLISFIDTPGHAAFTKMRARGAEVTDIAVLVVAADDGVMPQTVEAVNHARAAEVPIVIAMNKMDLPGANPDQLKQQLQGMDLTPEDWGGETIVCPVSAETGEGIETLLEMILLQAEMLELKAVPTGPASAVVIEAELDQGTGPVATILVREGRLKQGDALLAGPYWGKIRSMTDHQGRRLKEAGPSTPVRISRLSDVPEAGELVQVVKSDRVAKGTSAGLTEEAREGDLQNQRRVSLEDLYRQIEQEGRMELALVLKADAQGSIEAVADSIGALQSEKIQTKVIHAGVGPVSENDIELAAASDALVLAFQVKIDAAADRAAKHHRVEIRSYRVIYELVDEVRQAMVGRLAPEEREIVMAHADVRQLFPLRGGGVVAGCLVSDGAVTPNLRVRVLRNRKPIFDGGIETLRRFKDEAREVRSGQDCGIRLTGFDDVAEGDVIEAYRTEEVAAEL